MGSEFGPEELEWYDKHLKPLGFGFQIRELMPRGSTEGLRGLGNDCSSAHSRMRQQAC